MYRKQFIAMKKIKFEKISEKLTKEEMNFVKGGIKVGQQVVGDTEGGDTYCGGNAWQQDANGDKRVIHFD